MALGLSMVVGAAGYSQASLASARHSGQAATANAAVTCPGPGHRFKVTGSSAVYIYDSWNGGYRWITTQSVFDKYGFSSSKIQHWSSIDKSSILTGLPWSG